jgi:primosomal protein N'
VAAALGATAAGLAGSGVVVLASNHPERAGLAGLLLAAAAVLLLLLVIYGFHARCPACRGLFARRVLSKRYSHTATSQETQRDAQGRPITRTVQRRIYYGAFRCRRCGHRWEGYL